MEIPAITYNGNGVVAQQREDEMDEGSIGTNSEDDREGDEVFNDSLNEDSDTSTIPYDDGTVEEVKITRSGRVVKSKQPIDYDDL